MSAIHDESTHLRLWGTYSRRQIHDIFSPDTTFQPSTGTWGLQGIIKSPNREGDYLFLVTFGRSQGSHVFDESITTDGVLTWQSQPQQSLTERKILDFISHDERVNTIHLFLRTKGDRPYTYFGPLGYLTHDESRERPVYFQFQILEWPPKPAVIEEAALSLSPAEPLATSDGVPLTLMQGLHLVSPPEPMRRSGRSAGAFRGKRTPSYADRDARNAALGLAGEHLVLEMEVRRLVNEGRADLAKRVTHVSQVEGDSAGYDIRSFEVDGREIHLEVKTTRGSATAGFFLSANELAFSRANPGSYRLMRLFGYQESPPAAEYFILEGPLDGHYELEPVQYRLKYAAPCEQ